MFGVTIGGLALFVVGGSATALVLHLIGAKDYSHRAFLFTGGLSIITILWFILDYFINH